MAMATASASPSTFATLLRHSKFASFDPSIAQSYTAPAAHRARGQWGLKRHTPPTAPKHKYIFIPAADTPYNQMEWNSAEREVRFDRRWAEMGSVAKLEYTGAGWSNNIAAGGSSGAWAVDTEFGGGDQEALVAETKQPGYSRNVSKMSDRSFENYLEELRALRPQVKKFALEKKQREAERTRKAGTDSRKPALHVNQEHDVSLYALGQRPTSFALHTQYLYEHPPGDAHTRLNPLPHPIGALSHRMDTSLQTFLTHKATPGRVLGATREREGNAYLAGVAGHIGKIERTYSEGQSPPQELNRMADDPERGRANFRIWDARLTYAPSVVGQREGLFSARLEVSLRVVDEMEKARRNPHRPGSMEYVANLERPAAPPPGQSATIKPTSLAQTWRPAAEAGGSLPFKDRPGRVALLDTLTRLLGNVGLPADERLHEHVEAGSGSQPPSEAPRDSEGQSEPEDDGETKGN